MNTNEKRATELGMTYRKVDNTAEEIAALRKELDVPPPEHYCAACGKRLYNHFAYCFNCAEELGVAFVPYRHWPDQLKMWANDQRREERAEAEWLANVTRLYNDDDDGDGYEVKGVAKIAYNDYCQRHDHKTIEEMLERLDITTDQYDLLTSDNLRILSEHLGISHRAARQRKSRLVRKLNENLVSREEYQKQSKIKENEAILI